MDGFKAVVVAIVVEAVLKIAKKSFKSHWSIVIAILAFAAIYFFHVPFPLIVLAAAVLGIILLKTNKTNSAEQSTTKDHKPKTKHRILKIISVFGFFWVLPFIAVGSVFGFENIASKTYLFFTQAAFVTFGGAYSVLAYVNQSVVSAGWITAAQSVDGLALAETTPGPLIMVLQFIGFMTGWNNAGTFNQPLFATLCALLTTYVTFLPSFFFIFVGAPYIERLRHNQNLTSALSGVTAAVVGVILNLALMFGATVIFPNLQTNYFALVLAILSFAALYFLKADVLLVVIVGGLFGLAKYLFNG